MDKPSFPDSVFQSAFFQAIFVARFSQVLPFAARDDSAFYGIQFPTPSASAPMKIGIRVAMGARSSDIVRLVLREALALSGDRSGSRPRWFPGPEPAVLQNASLRSHTDRPDHFRLGLLPRFSWYPLSSGRWCGPRGRGPWRVDPLVGAGVTNDFSEVCSKVFRDSKSRSGRGCYEKACVAWLVAAGWTLREGAPAGGANSPARDGKAISKCTLRTICGRAYERCKRHEGRPLMKLGGIEANERDGFASAEGLPMLDVAAAGSGVSGVAKCCEKNPAFTAVCRCPDPGPSAIGVNTAIFTAF